VGLSIALAFALAVAVEGLAKFRHVVVAKSKRNNNNKLARYSIPVLHGLQAAAGYMLMLIAMTFSVELLLSVVAGLAVGYAIFFRITIDNDPYQLRQHVTTNPCCEFMEEESKETAAALLLTTRTDNNDDLTLILEGEEDESPPPRNSAAAASSRNGRSSSRNNNTTV